MVGIDDAGGNVVPGEEGSFARSGEDASKL